MKRFISVVALLATIYAPAAQAGLLQLTFSGTMTHELLTDEEVVESAYSGSIIIDANAADTDPDTNRGLYQNAVIGGSVQWDGVDYDVLQPMADIFVVDGFAAGAMEFDVFAALFDIQAADGSTFIFSLQFTDFTQSIFSSDAMPSAFELSQFSDYDFTDDFSTFASVIGPNISGGFDSAQLVAVPNAATLWLVTLGAILLVSRKHRARGLLVNS